MGFGGARLLAVVLGAGIVSGCADQMEDWRRMAAHRDGPQPLPTVEQVKAEASRQNGIMQTIFEATPPQDWARDNWYAVTLTGFNLVDSACISYLDDLHKFDRRKNQMRDLLTFANATTTTIAGVAGAPATSLVYLAQAFGFAASATDVFSKSYLYAAPPSTIAKIVYDLKTAYRRTTFQNRLSINSQAMSYIYIQDYLNQCLPETIEQHISSYIAQSAATDQPEPMPEAKIAAKSTTPNLILIPRPQQ